MCDVLQLKQLFVPPYSLLDNAQLDAKAEKGAGKSGKMAKAMHADEAIEVEASSLSMSSCMSLSSSVSLSLSTSMSS